MNTKSDTYILCGGILQTEFIDKYTLHGLLAFLREFADPELYDEETIIDDLQREGRYEGVVAYYQQQPPDYEPIRVPFSRVTGWEKYHRGWTIYEEDNEDEFVPYIVEIVTAEEDD